MLLLCSLLSRHSYHIVLSLLPLPERHLCYTVMEHTTFSDCGRDMPASHIALQHGDSSSFHMGYKILFSHFYIRALEKLDQDPFISRVQVLFQNILLF